MTGFEAAHVVSMQTQADSYCELWLLKSTTKRRSSIALRLLTLRIWKSVIMRQFGYDHAQKQLKIPLSLMLLYYHMTTFWPEIPGDEDCIKETLTNAYWNSMFIKVN